MPEMDATQRQAFLQSGTRTGHVAIVVDGGRPHVTPVWFVLDDDDVMFITRADSVKAKALAATHRAAISVDEPRAPYAFVMVDGIVSLSRDPGALRRWAVPIAQRYATDVSATVARSSGPDRVLVRVTPVNTVAITYA